jgi:cation:H+ antiporter
VIEHPALLIILGLFLLYIGAEWLVKASASIAVRLGISPMLVGLTVIGFGTSTPELIVNIDAIWDQYENIAFGNLMGSNLFNMAFIAGIALCINPVKLSKSGRYFDTPFMAFSCLLLAYFGFKESISFLGGTLLLLALLMYTGISYRLTQKHQDKEEGQLDIPLWRLKKCLPMLPISFAALVIGSNFLIRGSVTIAQNLGINESIIGLTVVACGTSLPELATTLLASVRRHTGIAIGNIIGSNIFNVFGVLGVMATIKPLHFNDLSNVDILVMLLSNLFFSLIILVCGKAGRITGTLLLLSYLFFFVHLLLPYF